MRLVERVADQAVDFNAFIRSVFQLTCDLAGDYIVGQMEQQDKQLMERRDKALYRYIGLRQTTIKTILGEISYSRRYYRKTDPETYESKMVFLLDEYLGIDQYSGKYSDDVVELAVSNIMNQSCRKSAESIGDSTIFNISHTSVWNLFQATAQKHEDRMSQLTVLNKEGRLVGNIKTDVLFEEADGVHISMQGKDRPRGNGKRELKVGTAYTGWRPVGKDRFQTVDKISYASFEDPSKFTEKMQALKANTFDVDGILYSLYSSDAGGWCKHNGEDANIQQIDSFHRNEAILRAIPETTQRRQVWDFLKAREVDGALQYIEALSKSYEEPKQVNQIKDLLAYFTNNRDLLLTWEERGLKLPTPPEGIVYRSLGTQEHSNANIICSRMKHNGTSWSTDGGGKMALMLCLRSYGGDPNWIYDNTAIQPTGISSLPEPLSAAKTPDHDGHGYDGGRHGGWPFAGASVTNGRKALRNIFEQRSFPQIRYQG